MTPHPPVGFSVRRVSMDDAEVIAEVINECMRAEIGMPWTSVEEVRDELTAPGREALEVDAVLEDRDGAVVGYLQLWGDIAPYTETFQLAWVRPYLWGGGLSAYLLKLGEERARGRVGRAPEGERVVLQVARFAQNDAAGRLFRSLGYGSVRTFIQMQISFDDASPRPAEVPGIAIRSFDVERDAVSTHRALSEAFEDHWGHGLPSYEHWRHGSIDGEGSGFDPQLWFVALDGEEIVGAACCRSATAKDPHTASVDTLGVRRAWRGRGIGLALLSTAFAAFHQRGIRGAELGVDAESPTGATRLYDRAGMHVDHQWEIWEKELRPAGSAG